MQEPDKVKEKVNALLDDLARGGRYGVVTEAVSKDLRGYLRDVTGSEGLILAEMCDLPVGGLRDRADFRNLLEKNFDDLLHVFWSFVGELSGTHAGTRRMLADCVRTLEPERLTPLTELLLSSLDLFRRHVKDAAREDSRTFAHLYRKVQRFVKRGRPDGLYAFKDGSWYGPAGLSEEEVAEGCSSFQLRESFGPLDVPLPGDAPGIFEFFSETGDMRSAPVLELLPHFWEAATEGLPVRLVSLQSFCYWLDGKYGLLQGTVSIDGPDGGDGERPEPPEPIGFSGCENLSPEGRICSKEVAERLFWHLTDGQRELFQRRWNGETLAELARRLKMGSAQAAKSRFDAFLEKTLIPRLQAEPDLWREDDSEALQWCVLENLAELCASGL